MFPDDVRGQQACLGCCPVAGPVKQTDNDQRTLGIDDCDTAYRQIVGAFDPVCGGSRRQGSRVQRYRDEFLR